MNKDNVSADIPMGISMSNNGLNRDVLKLADSLPLCPERKKITAIHRKASAQRWRRLFIITTLLNCQTF